MPYTLEELKAKQATGEIPAGTQINSSAGANGNVYTPVMKEPIIISTKQADNKISEADDKLAGLTTPKPPEIKPEVKETPKPEVKEPIGISYSDLVTTGEDVSLYEKQTDGSYVKKQPKTQLELDLEKEKDDVETATAEINAANDRLKSFDVSKDPELQGIISNISSQFDTRIRQMEEINRSRTGGLTQRGFRTGGRYTTSYAGIVSAEERAGMDRVGELEAQKQSAIISAQSAFKAQKWNEYVKFADLAEKSYEKQVAELSELNKKAVEQNKKIEEEKNKNKVGDAVYNAFAGGQTDTADIYATLRNQGIATTTKEVDDIVKILNPDPELTGLSADFKTFKQFFPDVDVATKEGQDQYLNWQAQVSSANRIASKKTGNTLTWSEAKTRKLPLELVGMSEQEILDQINSPAVPKWFRDALEKQEQQSLMPNIVQSAWDEYRQGVMGDEKTDTSGGSSSNEDEQLY